MCNVSQSGIDWLVVMPLFVVSQKYRKETGTLFAPMPIKLVEGTFKSVGKQYLWQVNGYWVHTIVQLFAINNPWSCNTNLNRVENHRKKFAEKQKKLAKEGKQE